MLSPVSRARKSTVGLRRFFRSSTPDLQVLKQKTLSEVNIPLKAPTRSNEVNISENEVVARRHGG